jgi:hypothetical protein
MSNDLSEYGGEGILNVPDGQQVRWRKTKVTNPFRIIPLGGENMIAVPQGFGGVVDVTLDDGRRYRITVAAKTGEYQISEEFGKWDLR